MSELLKYIYLYVLVIYALETFGGTVCIGEYVMIQFWPHVRNSAVQKGITYIVND